MVNVQVFIDEIAQAEKYHEGADSRKGEILLKNQFLIFPG
jgi:hypothetical protein